MPAKGGTQSPEAREAIRQAHLGKKLTDEQKDKISAANLGRKRTPEQRATMSQACIGRKHSEETKKAIAIGTVAGRSGSETKASRKRMDREEALERRAQSAKPTPKVNELHVRKKPDSKRVDSAGYVITTHYRVQQQGGEQ